MPKPADTAPDDEQLTTRRSGRFSATWDTNTALAVIAGGALAWLVIVNRSFVAY